jgi:GAF domain-containing protein
MVVPILTQNNLRGLLAVWRTGLGYEFVDSEFALLSSLAQQLASSLENARLFQEAQERANELALINRIISVLTGAASLQEALQFVINEVVEAYPVTRGAVTMMGLANDAGHLVELWIDAEIWQGESFLSHPLVNTATLVLSRAELERFFALTGHTLHIFQGA